MHGFINHQEASVAKGTAMNRMSREMNNLNDNAYLRRRIDLQGIVSQPCMVALRNFSHAYLVSDVTKRIKSK